MNDQPPVKIFRVGEISANAIKRRRQIFTKGFACGFHNGDDLMSYRKGFTTGIYSYSAQGKTQFWIEQAVWLSKEYNLTHAIWLTESGEKEELIFDIAMTYLGKSLFSSSQEVTDDELLEALEWMDKYFFVIDHETKILNVRDIYTSVSDFEKQSGISIDCVVIDNATNLARELDKSRLQTHEYMNYLMTAINRTSNRKNYHTFILFHVGKTDYIECKSTKRRYMPRPSHYEILGGQQVNYLGFQLIGVWRPINQPSQEGIIDPDTGWPFALNETRIIISKSKPKAIGQTGEYRLFFDKDRQKFYEEVNAKRYYIGEYGKSKSEPTKLKPNLDFDKPSEEMGELF